MPSAFLFPETAVGIYLEEFQAYWRKHERGSLPTPTEMIIIVWVQGLIWKSLKDVYRLGLFEFLFDLWNLADIFRYVGYMYVYVYAVYHVYTVQYLCICCIYYLYVYCISTYVYSVYQCMLSISMSILYIL